ncbi:MAG: hypothetical protein EP343_01090 [Deltaproteobacteria bacterium]|nr:MAG: hypothetical protein EP343_01090 [Deltaproteobacteria bacterium]
MWSKYLYGALSGIQRRGRRRLRRRLIGQTLRLDDLLVMVERLGIITETQDTSLRVLNIR